MFSYIYIVSDDTRDLGGIMILKRQQFNFKISTFEMRKIRAAAKACKESTSEYVRKATDQRMTRDELREEK